MTIQQYSEFIALRMFLNSIPSINAGGCGIAALAMFRWLETQRIKPHVVLLYPKHPTPEQEFVSNLSKDINFEYIQGKRTYPCPPGHIALLLSGVYIDSGGESSADYISTWYLAQQISKRKSLDCLIKAVHTPKIVTWNPQFDREQFLPKIENYLGFKL